jgi:cellulose synthase (UDP-forming)
VDQPFFDARIARPWILLALVNLAAIGSGAWKLYAGAGEIDSLVINVAWAVHNLVILGATIAAACERPQVRAAQRVHARLPAMLRLASGATVRCETRDLGRDGASLALAGNASLRPRDRVWLSLFSFDAERALPAEVLDGAGRDLRLRFAPLSLGEEAHLSRAIFSRADAWVGWTQGHRRDRPLLTLASIAGHGAAGMLRALRLQTRPRALPRRAPSPARSEA